MLRSFSDFRIFIDAATLKVKASLEGTQITLEFPHLYRCGHIEGEKSRAIVGTKDHISASL